ncbi:MAG TPA: RecX family transcriptional regulator [Pyrinomonadaceae bacterium]|nr:RecX family transcriptional regulator [Pyrinomonadaceae bacterium]
MKFILVSDFLCLTICCYMPRKKPAPNDEQRNLTPEEKRRRTFDRAIKLIAAKSRSVAELRERLLESGRASKTDVDAVIERLKEYGYLDDERFAFSYASLKVRQRPIGRRRLERDLKFKKVESTVANEALELVYAETSEAELIDRAIEKRIRLKGKPKNRLEAKSLFDHLLRQGFPYELVSDKVRAASNTDLDEEQG